MHLYTFGSNQGEAHVHWRVEPPGVPSEEQQGTWAGWDKGVLKIYEQEMPWLVGRIGRRS